MGATRFFYSHPPIILLLNFFGVSHKINIELTGMSVRALEKPYTSVQMHRNPIMSVSFAPLFLPHRYGRGAVVIC